MSVYISLWSNISWYALCSVVGNFYTFLCACFDIVLDGLIGHDNWCSIRCERMMLYIYLNSERSVYLESMVVIGVQFVVYNWVFDFLYILCDTAQ